MLFSCWIFVFGTRDSKSNRIPSAYNMRYYVPDIDSILYYVVVYYVTEERLHLRTIGLLH